MPAPSRSSAGQPAAKGIDGYAGSASEAELSVKAASVAGPTPPTTTDKPSTGNDPGDTTKHQIVMGSDDAAARDAGGQFQLKGISSDSYAIPGLHSVSETPVQPADGSFSVANVIDQDNRLQITNTQKYPFRAICSLLMTGSNGRQAIGTGWFAGPNLIVTAGHNLFNNDIIGPGWIQQVTVYPGRNGNSIPLSEVAMQNQLGVSESWLNQGPDAQQLDYGVIRLTGGLGSKVGWFGLRYWPSSELQGKQFNVVGYPQETSQIPPWTMWYDIGLITFVGQRTLQYKMDTTPGDSGCPVIAWVDDRTENGSMIVVGIHNYGFGNSYNQGTRVTPSVIDTIQQLSS